MAGFQKLDKKQLPQVIGLGVASCGLFGYFAVKMIAPTASAAPPPKTAASATAGTVAATASASSSDSSAPDANSAPVPDAPPPTLAMRDPFVPQENTDPDPTASTNPAAPVVASVPQPSAAPTASVTSSLPSVPPANLGPLPSSPGASAALPTSQPALIAALPPSAPAWTLTGVLESGRSEVAILRNGDARAYVQRGEMLDANFRVVDVTRSFVELRHGSQTYTLTLGGPKIPPAKPGTAPVAAPVPIPVPGSPLPQTISPAGTATTPTIPASTDTQITPSH